MVSPSRKDAHGLPFSSHLFFSIASALTLSAHAPQITLSEGLPQRMHSRFLSSGCFVLLSLGGGRSSRRSVVDSPGSRTLPKIAIGCSRQTPFRISASRYAAIAIQPAKADSLPPGRGPLRLCPVASAKSMRQRGSLSGVPIRRSPSLLLLARFRSVMPSLVRQLRLAWLPSAAIA